MLVLYISAYTSKDNVWHCTYYMFNVSMTISIADTYFFKSVCCLPVQTLYIDCSHVSWIIIHWSKVFSNGHCTILTFSFDSILVGPLYIVVNLEICKALQNRICTRMWHLFPQNLITILQNQLILKKGTAVATSNESIWK